MGGLGRDWLYRILAGLVDIRNGLDRLPHLEEDYGTDQAVLDGAGEQEGGQLLDQSSHDGGTGAATKSSRRGRRSHSRVRKNRAHIGQQGGV